MQNDALGNYDEWRPQELALEKPPWILFMDEPSNKKGCGVSLWLTPPNNECFKYALWFSFRVSNNEVEYETLIADLKVDDEVNVRHLSMLDDSQLIVNQTLDEYQAKEERM